MGNLIKKEVKVGNVFIGGENPVSIQSMLNASPRDIDANIEQALQLKHAGCEILRVAVPDEESAKLITELKNNLSLPIVADIHFDYKLALSSIDSGADKIRINPSNIGGKDKIKIIVAACKEKKIPIRIGLNSGSIEKDILEKYGKATPEAFLESALRNIRILEEENFKDIVISVKSSDVVTTIKAYRLVHNACDYPLHLGVTEAGTLRTGIIKSCCGIGSLLIDGIGDTIRFALTADPIEEVFAAKTLLNILNLRKSGVEIISCPTCGRTKIDLINLASEVEKRLSSVNKNIKVAIMGCAVNGPGEAKEADIGIAAGDGSGLIFKKGEIIKKVPEQNLLDELMNEVENM